MIVTFKHAGQIYKMLVISDNKPQVGAYQYMYRGRITEIVYEAECDSDYIPISIGDDALIPKVDCTIEKGSESLWTRSK